MYLLVYREQLYSRRLVLLVGVLRPFEPHDCRLGPQEARARAREKGGDPRQGRAAIPGWSQLVLYK
jgi:hypothetical protein